MLKIAIDCGHGGADSGCRGGGFTEAQLVWELGQRLTGFNKVITRAENESPPKAERAARAVEAGCSAALVLHFNQGEERFAKPEIYYMHSLPNFWGTTVRKVRSVTWVPPYELGQHIGFYDASMVIEPDDWLNRARNCLHHYTIPTILLEVGYLSSPKLQRYLTNGGLTEIAESLSQWVCSIIEHKK